MVRSCLDNFDLVCLQEHWFYAFEKHDIDKLLPAWKATVRCVDDENPISPISRPKGYGGTATLWKPWLHPFIRKPKEGNDRILPILIDHPSVKMCIINVYLPSGTSADSILIHEADLCQIKFIMNKYSDYEQVIIGDMNADLFSRKDKKEAAIQQLIASKQMVNLNQQISNEYTFRHRHQTEGGSHLDYILVTCKLPWKNSYIPEVSHINTSTHRPVAANLTLDRSVRKKQPPAQGIPVRKVKWSEGDPVKYQLEIDALLHEMDVTLLDTSQAVVVLAKILLAAELEAYPSTQPRRDHQGCGLRTLQMLKPTPNTVYSSGSWLAGQAQTTQHPGLRRQQLKSAEQSREEQRPERERNYTQRL